MGPQALRATCRRARPDFEALVVGKPLRSYFCGFSTTTTTTTRSDGSGSGDATEAGSGAGNPTGARARGLAAAMQINNLIKSRSEQPVRQRDGNTNNINTSNAAGEGPRVVDVKSIPRGLGRGMLRGRGGFAGHNGARAGAGATTSSSSSPTGGPGGNRFSPGGRAAPRGGATRTGARSGGFVRRGRGGARGAGSARGRAGKRRTGEDRDKASAAAGPRGKRTDPFERFDAAEQAFDDAMRFGTKTMWAPSLTLEGLEEHLPALPTARARVATVMQNLSVLGTAEAVAVGSGLQARSYAEEVEASGVRFFADVRDKRAAEEYLQARRRMGDASSAQSPVAAAAAEEQSGEEKKKKQDSGSVVIRDAEEAVRKAVLDLAVKGVHEAPRHVGAGDVVGLARAWHLKGGTWTRRDVERFEGKIVPLLQRFGGLKQCASAAAAAAAPQGAR